MAGCARRAGNCGKGFLSETTTLLSSLALTASMIPKSAPCGDPLASSLMRENAFSNIFARIGVPSEKRRSGRNLKVQAFPSLETLQLSARPASASPLASKRVRPSNRSAATRVDARSETICGSSPRESASIRRTMASRGRLVSSLFGPHANRKKARSRTSRYMAKA